MSPARAAVLGSPIAHSLSPVLHRAAYAALGLDWAYDAVECDEVALPATVDRLAATHRGLSLTMPLKRAVLPLLDWVNPLAAATGAANTVVIDAGRTGYNTDVAGLLAALAELGVPAGVPAAVLGGGATACSALAALAELGVRAPYVVVRDRARVGPLQAVAERLGVAPAVVGWGRLPDVGLVVSTVPAGAADPLATRGWPTGTALVDVVYAPWPTRLAVAAQAAGAPVVGGLAMLVGQAAEQVRLMTGQPAPVTAMRAAGERALQTRG